MRDPMVPAVAFAAKHLGVSDDWVYRNWFPRNMPFKMIGGSLRVYPDDFYAWVDRQ